MKPRPTRPHFLVTSLAILLLPALAHAAPDFYVKSYTVTVAGGVVTHTAVVCNRGDAAISFVPAVFYRNRTSAPACRTFGDKGDLIGASLLGKGACTTRTWKDTSPTVGTHQAWFFVDYFCITAESDETNNTASARYTVAPLTKGPDLYVKSLTATVRGNDVDFKADVCNKGLATTADVAVTFYSSLATAPGCRTASFALATVKGGLAAGACSTVTQTLKGVDKGSHTGWARADARCLIRETDEANNNLSVKYTVTKVLPKPDLHILSLTSKVSGSTAEVEAEVCNRGVATKANIVVYFYANRTTAPTCRERPTSFTFLRGGLAAGACGIVKTTFRALAPRKYTSWAFADPACLIRETDETNNTRSVSYTVTAPLRTPDYTIKSLTAKVTGTDVDFTANVCNLGVTDTSTVVVGFYASRSTAPGCLTFPASAVVTIVGGLAAGACKSITARARAVAPVGPKTGWARVDSICRITEKDETNNNASVRYTISTPVTPPDYYVKSYTTSVSGKDVTHRAVLCNRGGSNPTSATVNFYRDLSAAPVCRARGHRFVIIRGGLSKNECTTLTWLDKGVADGRYTGWVFVDFLCSIVEASETNNVKSSKYTVGGTVKRVDLVSFDARRVTDGVALSWRTGSEARCGAFRVLRCEGACTPGSYEPLPGARAIPCQDSASGAAYTTRDRTARPGATYGYLLREYETTGATNDYGPLLLPAGADSASWRGAPHPADRAPGGVTPGVSPVGCATGGTGAGALGGLLLMGALALLRRRR